MGEPSWFKICPDCSHSNPVDHDYCARCGKYVGAAVQETTQVMPPSPQRPERDSLSFAPGQKFGRRYVIIEEIGRGGMGRVYKAHDQELNIDVALKMIKPEYSQHRAFIQRFKQETLLGRSISHENVVRIHDLGEVEGIKFISMEYVKGPSLADLIRASGKLSEETTARILRQACQALAAAHRQGIVHQDLKPHNILIDHKGQVRMADFGLAISLEVSEGRTPQSLGGTPAYLSPEQARGEKADARSDIYSLGVVLYEMVTGQKPFEASDVQGYLQKHLREKPAPPSRLQPKLSEAIERIILRCLEKEPIKRFQSADEILEAMQELPAKRASRMNRLAERPAFRIGAAALAIALVLAALYLILLRPKPALSKRTEKISLAVMYFENDTGDPSKDYLRKTMAQQLIDKLCPSRYVRILTGAQLYDMLRQTKLLDKETYSTEDLKNVASRAGVNYILHGNFSKLGKDLQASYLLYQAKPWEARNSQQVRGNEDNLNGLVDDMIRLIFKDLKLSQRQIITERESQSKILTSSSKEALTEYTRGIEFFNERRFKESSECFLKAVQFDPQFALAYWRLALCDNVLERPEEVRQNLEKALALASHISSRENLLIRGLYAFMCGSSDKETENLFLKLLRDYPEDEEGNIYLGSLYRNQEEWDLAQERFEQAWKYNKYNNVIVINLLTIYHFKGQYGKAEEMLLSNRDLLSEEFFYEYAAKNKIGQSRYDDALVILSEGLSKLPDSAILWRHKAYLHQLRGEFKTAEEIYNKLHYDDDPNIDLLERHYWLANILAARGHFREAESLIRDSISRLAGGSYRPKSLFLRMSLAELYLRRGEFQESLGNYEQAYLIATKDNDPISQRISLTGQTMALLKLGRLDTAKQMAQELGRLVEHTGVRKKKRYHDFVLGKIAQAQGDLDQSINYYKSALTLLPGQNTPYDENAFYLESLASGYCQKEDWPNAARVYKDIIDLSWGRFAWGDIYALSHYWLAKVSEKQGLVNKANEYYRKFLEIWPTADPEIPEIRDAKSKVKTT